MQKKILSMILAIAMVVSMFAGIAITASAAGTWTLVESVSDIVAGGSYVILVNDKSASYNGVVSSKHLQTTAGWAFTGNAATATPETIVTVTFEAVPGVENAYYLKDSNGKYITATKAGSGGFAHADSDSYGWTFAAGVNGFKACYNNTEAAAGIWSYNNSSLRSYAYTGANYQGGTYDIYLATLAEEGACTHANTTSATTAEPNCTVAGVTTITCSDCGASWTEDIAALGHDWTEEVVTPADCTTDGVVLATCNREGCDESEERVIPATGHDFTNGDCACGEPAPVAESYVATALENIAADSEVIITMTNAEGVTYALSSANGTNSAPTAVVVEVANNAISVTDAALVWNITNAEGTLTIRPNGDAENALYCLASNNGVRVGTNANNTFNVDATYGYLFNIATSRYVGVYNNQDWRCYTTTPDNNNIKGQTLAFYVKSASSEGGEGGEPEGCPHTSASENGGWVCNADGTHAYICGLCTQTITENCEATVVESVDATCSAYSYTAYECSVCGGEWTVTGTEYGAHAWDGASCTTCGATRNVYTKVADPTALNDGDGIVIYYPAGSLLLSGTANGNKLNGVAAEAVDGTVYVTEGELFLIVRKDANGDFYFETEDGKYLTSAETGNGLSLEASLTDYAKWYFDTTGEIAALRICNRNAAYNGVANQALEYYNAFTVYGIKDSAAYAFEIYQREGFSAHTHTWDDGVVTTEATCTADGVKTYTCACGDTMTEAIPAIGHDFSAGDACANCPASIIKGQYTATIADGDTIIIYNPASNMALTNTASGYYLAGSAAIACGTYVISAAPEAAVWTVEIVDAEAGTFRLKTAEGIYLQTNDKSSFTNSAELAAEGETDYSVWTLVDGQYLKSAATNKAIEYYGGKWTTYGLSTTNTAFNLKLFKTNVESFCEHNYTENVISTPDCVTDGVSTFNCGLCNDTYTTTVAATGHSYELVEEVAATCTVDGSKAYECHCGDEYVEAIPATGHFDADLDGICDNCPETVEYDIWELSTTAPAAGNKYIIVALDAETGKYYALTTNDVNAATSAGVEVIVSEGKLYNPVDEVIYGAREHTYTSGDSSWTGIGFYISTAAKCLHLNSSKIRVTTTAQNGVFSFEAGTAENTFVMKGDVNIRYLTFSGTNFGVSSSAGTDLYFFYQVCEHEETYVSGAKDATCTEAGSTGTTKCAWCAAEVIAAEEIPAFGHAEVLIDNGDGTHYGQCSICLVTTTETTEHTFVDGVCGCGAIEEVAPAEPTLDSTLTFGAQLYLENDLTMAFRVKSSKLANYDATTAYLVVERDVYASGATEATVETMIISEYTITGDRLIFSYPGISAAQMNDAIRATLYVKDASGKEYVGPVYNTSIAFYLDGLLTNSASDTKLVTLIMDMVNYGAAAQVYFDRHADALVNEAYESFKTYASYASADFTTALENLATTEGTDGMAGKLNIALDLGTRIGAQYKVTVPADVNVEDVSLVITDADGNVLETFAVAGNATDSKGRYLVTFYGFTSRDMRRVVYATAYANGEAITGTYGYSISTYAWGIQSNAAAMDANLVAVTRAMMLYGDSASVYFAS